MPPAFARAAPITFTVRLTPFSWLTDDGDATDDESKAVTFTAYPSPLTRERTAILSREHEQAGGLKAWQDIHDSRNRLLERVREQVRAAAWPKGQPEAKTLKEQQEQDRLFRETWATLHTDERRQWAALNDMADTIAFLAAWPVVLVSPASWKALADMEAPPEIVSAIRGAYYDACEEGRKGKQKPSG